MSPNYLIANAVAFALAIPSNTK